MKQVKTAGPFQKDSVQTDVVLVVLHFHCFGINEVWISLATRKPFQYVLDHDSFAQGRVTSRNYLTTLCYRSVEEAECQPGMYGKSFLRQLQHS